MCSEQCRATNKSPTSTPRKVDPEDDVQPSRTTSMPGPLADSRPRQRAGRVVVWLIRPGPRNDDGGPQIDGIATVALRADRYGPAIRVWLLSTDGAASAGSCQPVPGAGFTFQGVAPGETVQVRVDAGGGAQPLSVPANWTDSTTSSRCPGRRPVDGGDGSPWAYHAAVPPWPRGGRTNSTTSSQAKLVRGGMCVSGDLRTLVDGRPASCMEARARSRTMRRTDRCWPC
jgi:hypothetical protein